MKLCACDKRNAIFFKDKKGTVKNHNKKKNIIIIVIYMYVYIYILLYIICVENEIYTFSF